MVKGLLLLAAASLACAVARAQPPAVIDRASGTAYISTGGVNILAHPMLGQEENGQVIPMQLDDEGRLIVSTQGASMSTVTQGPAGTEPWLFTGDAACTQSGTWTTGRTWTLDSTSDSVNVGNFPAIQPVSQSGTWTTGRTWTTSDLTDSMACVQSGAWTTGRTWNLSSGSDSVSAVQSGTWTVQQGTPPWSVSQSGTWTVQQGTPPWSVSQSGTWTTGRTWTLSNSTDSVASVQSGAWTTGRTWTMSSGTDSVASVQSGNWSTRTQDGAGNLLTSQASGSQRALDVGVNVAGVQVDPRTRTWTLSSSTDSVKAQLQANDGTALSASYGTASNALRTASQIGNASGAADFNSGSTTAQTIRTASNLYDSAGTGVTLGQKTAASSLPVVQYAEATYSAAITGLVVATTPTDVFCISGSGTKTVKVRRVDVSATQNTASVRDVLLIKRSTANTGGTSSSVTLAAHDSNDAAATASVLAYTANPTLGTTVATIRSTKMDIEATNLVGASDRTVWIFGSAAGEKPIVLRGTAQSLCVNLNGVTSSNNSFNISVEETEE